MVSVDGRSPEGRGPSNLIQPFFELAQPLLEAREALAVRIVQPGERLFKRPQSVPASTHRVILGSQRCLTCGAGFKMTVVT